MRLGKLGLGGCFAVCWMACGSSLSAGAIEASQRLYVRSDTDRTTVVSPRSDLAAPVTDALQVQAAYAADIWTGASIDVRTAATHAIVETRHEVNLGATYSPRDWTFSTSYRYSIEPDYVSHGGVLSAAANLAQNNTTVELQGFFGADQVGRSGDPGFQEGLQSGGAQLGMTQVLSAKAIAQVAYEVTYLHGFQASVYRYVALLGDGTCAGLAAYCLPEQLPEARLRQSATGRVRYALSASVSAALQYRFYFDSWGLRSHTLSPELAYTPLSPLTLRLDYRGYIQGAADFYRERYLSVQGSDGYVTRDRKLSPHTSHQLALSAEVELPAVHEWALGARAGLTRYHYRAFVGLQHVYALDLSAFVSADF